MINKNALRRVSLACLEISYEMGVIYSARNRISSLKVFHFLLYPRSSIYFFRIFTFYIVFDVVWVRVYKYTKINSREITSLPERKSVAADQITRDCRNYWGGGRAPHATALCYYDFLQDNSECPAWKDYQRFHSLKDKRVHNMNKIKGLYKPTLESVAGFVLICSKSKRCLCWGGGGGGL